MARFYIPDPTRNPDAGKDIPGEVFDTLIDFLDEEALVVVSASIFDGRKTREVDLIIITSRAIHVIEVKDLRDELHVTPNGPWEEIDEYGYAQPLRGNRRGEIKEMPDRQAYEEAEFVKRAYGRNATCRNVHVYPYVLIPYPNRSNSIEIGEGSWVWIVQGIAELRQTLLRRDQQRLLMGDRPPESQDVQRFLEQQGLFETDYYGQGHQQRMHSPRYVTDEYLGPSILAKLAEGLDDLDTGGSSSAALARRKTQEEAKGKLALGKSLLEQGRPEEAITVLLEGAQLAPKLQGLQFALGSAYFELKRWPEAASAYQRELAVSSGSPETEAAAHYNLGTIAWVQDQILDAVKEYQAVLLHYPNDADINERLGDMYNELEDYAKAEVYYRAALSLDPNRPGLHLGLAECHQRRGALQKAVLECQAELAVSHDYEFDVYGVLAEVHAEAQNHHEMLIACGKLSQLKPDDFETHLFVGNLCVGARRWERAKRAYRRAVELKPDCAEAHFGLARAYIGMKRQMEAAVSARKALELGHEEARALLDDLDNREQATE